MQRQRPIYLSYAEVVKLDFRDDSDCSGNPPGWFEDWIDRQAEIENREALLEEEPSATEDED